MTRRYASVSKPLTDLEKRLVAFDQERVRRGGLRTFVELAWPLVEPGQPYKPNWSVDAVCEHLEALFRKEIRQLCVNIPPACMKSKLSCLYGPLWAWIAINPSLRWLFTSYDAKLTRDESARTLRLVQTKWFQDRWGTKVLISEDAAEGYYLTAQDGERFATSVGGKTTGRHPDVIVIDDPMKPKDLSKTALSSIRNWYNGTMRSRGRNPEEVLRLCIMQRLHESDLAQMFIDEGGWTHLKLPMEFDSKERSRTVIAGRVWQDPRKEDGDLLWPSRFGPSAIEGFKKAGAYVWASQYQQRPAPESGLTFQRAWFQSMNPETLAKMRFDRIIQSWDCTFKDSDGTDYVVGQVWGALRGSFYLLDEVRGRMSFSDTLEAVKALSRKWPKARAKLIEDKANGPAIISTLKKELPGIIEVQPLGGKLARANAVQPFFESMNVFQPDPDWREPGAPEEAPSPYRWVDDWREELANFPTAAHDDRVDACTQAIAYFVEKRTRTVAAMEALEKNPTLW
jgi:predicted phage terminase large subunit-like protein